MSQKIEKIGNFNFVKVNGEKDLPTIILFHGYGANCFDLVSLNQFIHLNGKKFNWIFPDGPLNIPIMPGIDGKAWFPINIPALQEGSKRSYKDSLNGLENVRILLNDYILELGIPISNLILGGFSQGSMVATELSLTLKEKPKALIILSGAFVRSEWFELAKQRNHLQFFQSHGEYDPVLPFSGAKKLEKTLRDAELMGEFISFPGGHEIPMNVIEKLNLFLNRIV